jgi:hypothetical protein
MKGIFTKLVALLLLLGSATYSQIPRIINYQGLLLGTNQQPVPDGNYDLTLSLYDEPGNLLWTEAHTSVMIKSGLFQVLIGSITQLDLPFDHSYFLGIKVGSDAELVPRMMLTSAAYSFNSANAEAVDSIRVSKIPIPNTILPLDATGMFPSSVLPSGSGGSGTVTQVNTGSGLTGGPITTTGTISITDNGVTSSMIQNGTIKATDIGQNQVIKSVNSIRDSVTLVAGSNITITPSGNNLTINSTAGGLGGSGTANYLPLFAGTTTLGNSVISQTSGNLGIGTTTPTVKLELAGSDAKIYGLTIGRGSGSVGTNQAFGYQSLYSNTTGLDNIAIGHQSLYSNTYGNANTGVGLSSLYSNTVGSNNTAVGWGALYSNAAYGDDNTAVGYRAQYFVSGQLNTSVGYRALEGSGSFISNLKHRNTAIGSWTLYSVTTGNYNTALGHDAGDNLTSGSNNSFIGYDAWPSSPTVSNEITLGDPNITTLRCNATSISSLSDARDKKNIRDLPLGLDFLMTVKPRLFNWDRREWYEDRKPDGSKMQQTPTAGFIAQELDTAQINANAEWLNLVLKTNLERFEATAGNLLPIMVKAIQELKNENDSLRKELDTLRGSIAEQIKTEVKEALLRTDNPQKNMVNSSK